MTSKTHEQRKMLRKQLMLRFDAGDGLTIWEIVEQYFKRGNPLQERINQDEARYAVNAIKQAYIREGKGFGKIDTRTVNGKREGVYGLVHTQAEAESAILANIKHSNGNARNGIKLYQIVVKDGFLIEGVHADTEEIMAPRLLTGGERND